MKSISKLYVSASLFATLAAATAAPQYNIYDIGVVQASDFASQAFYETAAGMVVGRSLQNSGTQAYYWTLQGGIVRLPNLDTRPYCVATGANDNGIVVGSGAVSAFGTNRLPLIWQNGTVSQLPLPSGRTLGDANGVNASGVVVGSVGSGTSQIGAIYSNGSSNIITNLDPNGSYFVSALGINDSGRIVGVGRNPNNAAVDVGLVYDTATGTVFDVGVTAGKNGAIAYAVSSTGYVVGASTFNTGSSVPFFYSDAGGSIALPLLPGLTQGTARGVNSAGWVVGSESSQYSVPFLYDGTTMYRLQDLIPADSGWDLATNTVASAYGISDNGVIVGTGVHNGVSHAYAMVPVRFQITSVSDTNGSVTIQGVGLANRVYTIKASPDLSANSFVTIGTATTNSSGVWQFTEEGVGGETKRFYEATYP